MRAFAKWETMVCCQRWTSVAVLAGLIACDTASSGGVTDRDTLPVQDCESSANGTRPPGCRSHNAAMPDAGTNAAMPDASTNVALPDASTNAALPDASTNAALSDASTFDANGAAGGSQVAVSADMMNRTLSIVDVNRLVAGGTRSDALLGTVDLSAYAPGPMSLNITPDGKTALVSISVGFLDLIAGLPAAEENKLLFVDLATRTVTAELNIGYGPMGIAITPDGKRAFVGLFGETYMAEVDIAARTFRPIETGELFNEELAIDDSGEVALLTFGPFGDVRSFSIAEPDTVFGRTTDLDSDAAGVAFFPGTKIAYLMQAATPLTLFVGGHDIIDVADPTKPVASDHVRDTTNTGLTYPVTAVAARKSVAYPVNSEGRLRVVEVKLEGNVAKDVQTIEVGESGLLNYGIGATRDGRVLVTDPEKHNVAVVDLAAGTGFLVPWEGTEIGPTEIKVIPQQAALSAR